MKIIERYLSSTTLVTAIGIIFSTHTAFSSTLNEMEFPVQEDVSSSSIASQMPDNPLLSSSLNEKLRQTLKNVKNIKPSDLYDLVNNHIVLDLTKRFGDKFGNQHSIECLVDSTDELASKILGNHSIETIDLFLHCVNLANVQRDACNKAEENSEYFYTRDFMRVSSLRYLMEAVLAFPEQEQILVRSYIGILAPLLGSFYDNGCIREILESLKKIPVNNRESTIQSTTILAELDPEPVKIMNFLSTISEEEVPAAIKCFKEFDDQFPCCISFPMYNPGTLSKVLNSSAEDKKALHDIIHAFLSFPGMDSGKNQLSKDSRSCIFDNFQRSPKLDIDTLTKETLRLREKVHQLVPFHDLQDLEDLFNLFWILAPMKSEQRLAIMDDLDIIEGTTWENKGANLWKSDNQIISYLFYRLTQCKKHNPVHYRKYFQELLDKTNNKTLGARIAILGFLEEKVLTVKRGRGVFVPVKDDEIGPNVRRLSRLFAYLLNDTAGFEETESVIKQVDHINCVFRNLDEIIPFLERPLSKEKKYKLVEILMELILPQHRAEGWFSYVRLDDRTDFMDHALRLCQLNIDNPDHGQIFNSLAAYPFHERQGLVDRIVALEKDVYTNEDILNTLGANRGPRKHWFDMDNNQPLGTNVHEGDRDQRVTEALHTLIADQGHVGTQELEKAISDCKNYINEGDFTPEVKKRALNALFGPNSPNGWSNLWSQSVSSAFANLDGVALIGRLWKYADTFVDPQVPQETENARRSFVMACADCSDVNGFTICNLGKVQRIVCGVLQGRLPNVVIDKAVVDQKSEKQEMPEQENSNVGNDDEAENSPSGKELAALYLMTLQNQELPRAEAAMLREAFTWLRNQEIELKGQMRTEFVDDVKAFFEMMKD